MSFSGGSGGALLLHKAFSLLSSSTFVPLLPKYSPACFQKMAALPDPSCSERLHSPSVPLSSEEAPAPQGPGTQRCRWKPTRASLPHKLSDQSATPAHIKLQARNPLVASSMLVVLIERKGVNSCCNGFEPDVVLFSQPEWKRGIAMFSFSYEGKSTFWLLSELQSSRKNTSTFNFFFSG